MSLTEPAGIAKGAHLYRPHQPEQSLLDRLVETVSSIRGLHVGGGCGVAGLCRVREFVDDLWCGRLEHGFYSYVTTPATPEHLVAFSCKHRGFPQLRGRVYGSSSPMNRLLTLDEKGV